MLSRPELCDPTQFPARPRRVLNLFETHPIELYHLTIVTADGRRERLGTTGNHPFHEASERRFVPARELRPGCRVVTVTGAIADVEAVEVHTAAAGESFTTYNIEVEEDHTYHVGELGTWVHNESAERCLELAREAADGSEEAVEELRRIFSKAPKLRRSIDGQLREIVDDDILGRIDGPSKATDPRFQRMAAQEAVEKGSLIVVSPRSAVVRASGDAEHHIFSQSRRAWFKKRYNINVDDFVIDVDALTHDALHAGKSALNNKAGWWDHELMTRIRDAEALLGQKLTREQVIDVGNDLLKRFRLDQLSAHPSTK